MSARAIADLHYLPGGDSLLVVCSKETQRWQLERGTSAESLEVGGYASAVSPDGKLLVVAVTGRKSAALDVTDRPRNRSSP